MKTKWSTAMSVGPVEVWEGVLPVTRPESRTVRTLVAILAVVSLLFVVIGCGGEGGQQYATSQAQATREVPSPGYQLSETARAGEELFNANCSICHGVNAAGTGRGPTLIDRIYHPGHHSDLSFRSAVRQGVRQHHWTFGNMAPVPGVSPGDVDKVICYIRELQRAERIFEGDAFFTVC